MVRNTQKSVVRKGRKFRKLLVEMAGEKGMRIYKWVMEFAREGL